ncbi:TetR/AcrR family transcriptional regulator [Leisingera thetidis]|uniref:TetR/AcrR family transcriptional regulator n=1 Tax=Leisingera thetidis TaxID=2930199 RepID=UPI0021F6B08D|nr:helix-turn-helix domain-containing protein [Leisingera thetidis]
MDTTNKTDRKDTPLDKADWIAAARRILVSEGISGLSLRRLAAELDATTGAFYWLFSNLDELLEALREDWEIANSAAFTRVFDDPNRDCRRKYLGYVRVLLSETDYDPKYDNAIRDWAHSCPATAEVLKKVDTRRIGQLEEMFNDFGFQGRAARVRALTTYFHQSGYYRMGVTESLEERLANVPYYAEILMSADLLPPDLGAEEIKRLIFESD